MVWNGGTLDIVSSGSDGLDISGSVAINDGDLTINTTAESQRSIKVSGLFTMTGGTISGNTATGNGAGVYMVPGAMFTYCGSGIASTDVVYLANTSTTDCYINVSGTISSTLTVECASPVVNTVVARKTSNFSVSEKNLFA